MFELFVLVVMLFSVFSTYVLAEKNRICEVDHNIEEIKNEFSTNFQLLQNYMIKTDNLVDMVSQKTNLYFLLSAFFDTKKSSFDFQQIRKEIDKHADDLSLIVDVMIRELDRLKLVLNKQDSTITPMDKMTAMEQFNKKFEAINNDLAFHFLSMGKKYEKLKSLIPENS